MAIVAEPDIDENDPPVAAPPPLATTAASREADFQRIYNKSKARVLNYISRSVRDRDEALDLLQEVFITFYDKLPELDISTDRIESWLVKTARNVILTYVRDTHRRLTHDAVALAVRLDGIAQSLAVSLFLFLDVAQLSAPDRQRPFGFGDLFLFSGLHDLALADLCADRLLVVHHVEQALLAKLDLHIPVAREQMRVYRLALTGLLWCFRLLL
jgi:RNA polymerase sigma factor (sigma-70 family)